MRRSACRTTLLISSSAFLFIHFSCFGSTLDGCVSSALSSPSWYTWRGGCSQCVASMLPCLVSQVYVRVITFFATPEIFCTSLAALPLPPTLTVRFLRPFSLLFSVISLIPLRIFRFLRYRSCCLVSLLLEDYRTPSGTIRY